jgi:hypothetical protein
MADCNDLFQRRDDLRRQRRDVERQLREVNRSLDLDNPPGPAAADVVFRTRKPGERVVMNPREVDRQLQYALKQAQGTAIADQVERGFGINEKPQGRIGRMVNYTQLTPDQESVAKMLEAFSVTRKDLTPELHGNLTRKYTPEAAAYWMLDTHQEFLKDKEGLLKTMVQQIRGLEYLPEIVTRVRLMKEDAVASFLEAGDAMVNQALANPHVDVDVSLTNDAWAAGKWALILNELDTFAARRVAQAQVSRQFKNISPGRLFQDFDSSGVVGLSREQIDPRTLMGQIMLHVDSGDIHGLKNLLSRARSLQKTGDLDLNADWFNQHMRDLSTLRKDGLLSGLQTLAYRNPLGAAGMFFHGVARQGVDASLRLGNLKGLLIATRGIREALANSSEGFRMARDSWTNGRSLMEPKIARINGGEVAKEAAEHDELIDRLFSAPFQGNPAERALVAYGKAYAAWRLLGKEIGLPSLPGLRAMGAADEYMRWLAYTSSVRIQAETSALETLGMNASRQQIDEFVAREIQQVTFRGEVTPEDLLTYRRTRGWNAATASDSEITQRIANELVGAPTLNSEVSKQAYLESQIATGTQDFPEHAGGQILQGFDRLRSKHWQLDYIQPFFRNPVNMAMFTVDTAFPIRPATSLTIDAGRMVYDRLTKGSTDVRLNRLAMAQTIVAGTMFGAWAAGHAGGLIRGGGPQDPERRREWLRFNRPYSIGPEGEKSAQLSLAGVDPFDVLFVWSDLADLVQEGKISVYDQQTVVTGIAEALGRIVRRKAGFTTIARFLDWINDPVRNKVTDVLALTAGSFVPQIGNLRDAARVVEPDDRVLRTRPMTAEERYQLGDDRLNQLVAELKDFTYQALPLAGVVAGAARERDWLGTKLIRPFGVALDAFVPFMPVLMPDSPVHKWLYDSGIVSKPRANGILGGIQMSPELEARYRERMSTVVAPAGMLPSVRLTLAGQDATVSFTGKKVVMVDVNGTKIPQSQTVSESASIIPVLDRVTKGRNLHDALLALKNDPWYAQIDSDPVTSTRPDINDMPVAQRRRGVTQKLVNAIINYYDQLAQDGMRNSSDPVEQEWAAKEQALNDARYADTLKGIQQTLPRLLQGVGR